MKKAIFLLFAAILVQSTTAAVGDLHDDIRKDYDDYLAALFDHFHRNPELSLVEFETASHMAAELRDAGYEVTERVGGTGVVALMKNSEGPFVMMRADMDGLPVEEKSGLPNASEKTQKDPITGNIVFRVEPAGYPTSSPTDPDEQVSRIRFLSVTVSLHTQSDRSGLPAMGNAPTAG